MNDEKEEGRSDEKKDNRIAIQTVRKTGQSGGGEIFFHREGPDVTQATIVEIARVRVMHGMLPFPMMKGGEAENAGEIAPKFVGSTGAKERIVRAVVENDKDSNQKSPR